ncbi:hypothetical protein [Treponema sp. Marseille-Q3903]|uniref:hypothetical protein n=1 Tax=Treponema sp. Marseille-Q3903 TaxID=2766703 RepID=UPI0016527401|nr:hypothetical protein [Treponema sp. Marseille-Q3903]MBC6714014.1 hypothetical protein [Treponema sp. Marseille-Q3903]
MMSICGGCGKLINSEFHYCPWCGYSCIEEEKQHAEQLRYAEYKSKIVERQSNQIKQMSEQLDNLEEELSVLVLSVEMHR